MKKFTIAVFAVMLFTANIFAQTWTQQTSPVGTDLNSAWAVNDQICWMCGPSGVVVRTTNGGTSWALANTGLAGNDFYTICGIDANNCWVGAGDGGLWHTTNGGTAWTFVSLSPATPFIDVVHFFDANYGFVMGDPSASQWRYYITTNGGTSWALGANAPASVGTEAGWNNSYCALDTGHIWWGTNVTKIWKGSFKGPFTGVPTIGAYSFGVWFNDANLGTAIMETATPTTLPINLSTNGGTSWSVGSFTPTGVSFALRGVAGTGYQWIGTQSNIYRSTNNGASWTSQFTTANAIYGLTFYSQGLGWTCTATGKIYKYVDPNFTGVGNNNQTPKDFALGQNYPNPFNPSTTINYTIPQASNVTIKVYDLLGHEVMNLVDGFKTAGNHSTFVDASNLASGVYVYKMNAGDFSDVKRMTLVK